VVLKPDEPDGIVTGLTPLTRDKFREVLGDTRSGCHSILRDNIVERLQPYSLRRSPADIKGGVFEDFLGKTFRDDLGQYFTSFQSGTSLPRVSASHIPSVKLPIPPDLAPQEEIADEITRRRAAARRLRAEAEQALADAKAKVERMILGEAAA
jgi:hypothetical protein